MRSTRFANTRISSSSARWYRLPPMMIMMKTECPMMGYAIEQKINSKFTGLLMAATLGTQRDYSFSSIDGLVFGDHSPENSSVTHRRSRGQTRIEKYTYIVDELEITVKSFHVCGEQSSSLSHFLLNPTKRNEAKPCGEQDENGKVVFGLSRKRQKGREREGQRSRASQVNVKKFFVYFSFESP